MKTNYRIIDYTNDPKPVKTLVGAIRLAKQLVVKKNSVGFVTIQENLGLDNWKDIQTFSISSKPDTADRSGHP